MCQNTSNRLKRKYYRLRKKLQKIIHTKQFETFSITRKEALLNRLLRYENHLARRGTVVLGIATLLLSGTEAIAQQPTKTGEEFRVNNTITGAQLYTKTAINGNGDFTVVWQGLEPRGIGTGIYARRYNNRGIPEGSEFLVNTEIDGNQFRPDISMNTEGDFIVVWHSDGIQDGDGSGVYGQRYNNLGIPQGNEFQINQYITAAQLDASVAMNEEGDFVIAWTSRDQDGDEDGIFARAYDQAGVPKGDEFQVNTYTTGDQLYPDVAIDDEGDFVVTWASRGQDGSSYGAFAQRYSRTGVKIDGEFQVSDISFSSQTNPKVGMDGDGDFIITWQEIDDNNYGVFAKRYDKQGMPIGNKFLVNTYMTNNQRHPEIAVDKEGDFVIIWSSDMQDGDSGGIYAQQYDKEGERLGEEFQVNTYTTNRQFFPAVALNESGSFICSWQSLEQDRNDEGVYAQFYSIPDNSIPDISTLQIDVCDRPYTASFDPVENAIGYQLEITILHFNNQVITRRVNDATIRFNLPNQLLGTELMIRIAAVFLDEDTGEKTIGEFSNPANFVLACDEAENLTIENRSALSFNTKIFPNPVHHSLQIQLDSKPNSSIQCQLIDLEGKVLLRQQIPEGQSTANINVEQLSAGQYFLRLQSENRVEQIRFIKI